MGDSNIFEGSALKRMIENGIYLGADIPSLKAIPVCILPYLIRDCALRLLKNMMKSYSVAERRENPY